MAKQASSDRDPVPAGSASAPIAVREHREAATDHGAVSAFNAWFFGALAAPINHFTGPHKHLAFAAIAAGNVVELGAGSGANVRYLQPGSRLYAIEPNRRMHERLRRACTAHDIELVLLTTGAEHLPLPDACVQEVICSLVLCTVSDPDAVLGEVRRVLRPGGRFRYIEHVAAPPGIRSQTQRVIRRPWAWVFEGCDTQRETAASIDRAGFRSVESSALKLHHSPFWPVNTAVWGIAIR